VEKMVDNFWYSRSVLVTGGTGLVGGWLVKELLKRGARVSGLIVDADTSSELYRSGDVHKINVINGDLASYENVSRAVSQSEAQTIIHLGAQTIVGTALRDPLTTFKANIEGTWNVLEAARRMSEKVTSIVVASSDKAYGTSDSLPYVEDQPLRGEGPYDVSKSCTDLIAQTYGLTYGLPVTIARCGNIYGGGDLNWSRIVPGTLRDIYENRVSTFRSDGTFTRDYVHVLDIVDAYLHLAESTESKQFNGEAFNFSRDEPLSVLDIHKEIYKASDVEYRTPTISNSAKSEIKDQHLDSKKARELLGWTSKVTLQEGLKLTAEWYKNYLTVRSK
jgi:CDP-glucose 4,6-dehydratase